MEAARSFDERTPRHPLPEREDSKASDAENDDDEQRRTENRAGHRECVDSQWEHRHRVDHAQGHDRDGNRLEIKWHPAQPAQSGDFYDVVEPERQNHSTGGGRSARRETSSPVGALAAGKQLLPSECAEAEAGQIQASSQEDEGDTCAVQGPARAAQKPSDEDARAQREKRECESTESLQRCGLRWASRQGAGSRLAPPLARIATGSINGRSRSAPARPL